MWRASMFTSQIEAALSLIALSIFADKRVLSSEITAFAKSADQIQAQVKSNIPITEAKLLVWFEMNRETIRGKMALETHEFQAWLETLLADVAGLPNKSFILDIVRSISNADGELHISERALSVLLEKDFTEAA